MPRRELFVVLVTALLCLSLIGTMVAFGTDRGVLNTESIQSTSEAVELHEVVREEIVFGTLRGEFDQRKLPFEVPFESILQETITSSYVQYQLDTNVERSVVFLRAETDTFNLTIQIRPLFEELIHAVTDSVVELEPADFGFDRMDRMAQNETAFIETKDAYANATRETLIAELDSDLASLEPPDQLEESYRSYGMVGVDALTTEMGYSTYIDRLETEQQVLGEVTGTYLILDADGGISESIDIVEEPPTLLERLQPITGSLGLIGGFLAFLSVGLIGAIVYLYPTQSLQLRAVSIAFLVAGVLGLLMTVAIPAYVNTVFEGFNPTLAEVLSSMTASLLGVTQLISALWLLVGIGLGIVWMIGYLDKWDELPL